MILVANSVSLLLEQLHFTKLILKSLGFIPHPVKSMLTPSQSIDHLGFVWNSVNFTMSVPVQKILDLKLKCEKALSSSVSLRFLSIFLVLLKISGLPSHMPHCITVTFKGKWLIMLV